MDSSLQAPTPARRTDGPPPAHALPLTPPFAPWVSWVAALLMVIAIAYLRLVFRPVDRPVPVPYFLPLLLFLWLQYRRPLWVAAAGMTVVILARFAVLVRMGKGGSEIDQIFDVSIALASMATVTAVLHALIGFRRAIAARNIELETSNAVRSAREEEIARQNEELQTTAEELARQSEELRHANEELLRREKTLEALLNLSRALGAELSTNEALGLICRALSQLVAGAAAAAIVLRDGNDLHVRCHHGFGPGGVQHERFPFHRSFARLVTERGQTGYLEDLTTRPDLQIPQPLSTSDFSPAQPLRAVLSAPLRVGRAIVGALEVYSRDRTTWTQEQIALVESLAAQTSVSLETAGLFNRIDEERRRLETVIRTVPVGLAVATADGNDIRFNPAGATLFSVPPGHNLRDPAIRPSLLFYRDGAEVDVDQLAVMRALRSGELVLPEEVELFFPDGRRVVLLLSAAPVRDREGKILGAVAVFVDVTAQNTLQHELDRRRREAEESSARKTRFLAAVSHDIRTPANAISLLAELIERTASRPELAGEVPELATELQTSALSLVNLVTDVLDLTRMDAGRVELHEQEFCLNKLLTDECTNLRPLAEERGLNFSFDLPPHQIWVRTDPVKLGRVMSNLVGNAIKFTDTGEVRITLTHISANSDGSVCISVRDTGIGIATEHQPRIFDEFFQLRHRARSSSDGAASSAPPSRGEGSGLGLTISKRLVDAMGGSLTVQSQPGDGSTFLVTLPPERIVPHPSGGRS